MKDYLPQKDKDLQSWITNFINIATDNLPALGLSSTDLTPVADNSVQFVTGLTSVVATKNSATGAVKGKDAAKKTLNHNVRVLVKRIQAHPGVSVDLKSRLGINADNGGRTNTPPITPADVMAQAQSTGINSIFWNKNGNIPNTQFVVEAKKPADAAWAIIGQTTKARFDHTGQTPGVALSYRIVAARADKASAPSVVVTVYGG